MTKSDFQHIATHRKITLLFETIANGCGDLVKAAETQAARIELLERKVQQLESMTEFLVGKLERPL